MLKQNQDTFQFLILFVVILISRLPLLSAGYGVEEDSWGMINVLRRIHDTGLFEISRFPGHPVLEVVYNALYGSSYFIFNFCTALVSTAGFLFFAASLKELGFKKYFWSAFALAFIPVIYIKCTDTMDFMWGLSFMMVSFYYVLKSRSSREISGVRKNLLIAGIALGLAVGARFTSGVFLLPLTLLIFDLSRKETWTNALTLILSALITSLICFIPAMRIYDPKVFYAPLMPGYPDLLKIVYKAGPAVFGMTGCILLAVIIIKIFSDRKRKSYGMNKKYFLRSPQKLLITKFLFFNYSCIILYTLIFAWQPHKAAYLIPVLPFLIMLLEFYSNEKYSIPLAVGMLFSSFFLGINLEDEFRGVQPSPVSISMKVASQGVTVDFLKGPVLGDHARRKQKMDFAQQVIRQTGQIQKQTVIIAGWWINEIEVLAGKKKDPIIHYFYFLSENELKQYKQQGCDIYYLPQQDQVNDMRWQQNFTRNYARPMFSDNGQKLLF